MIVDSFDRYTLLTRESWRVDENILFIKMELNVK